MMTIVYPTASLGELVAAAFDEAALYSADPREISRLATRAVMHILRRARKPPLVARRWRPLARARYRGGRGSSSPAAC